MCLLSVLPAVLFVHSKVNLTHGHQNKTFRSLSLPETSNILNPLASGFLQQLTAQRGTFYALNFLT